MLKAHSKKLFWIFAGLIFFLNFFTKIFYVSDISIWYDESISLFNAQKNILRVFEYSALDNTPPVYNVFLFLWIRVFGISELAIRFPSVLFASVTAVLLMYFGYKKKHLAAGVFMALFFTLSNYCIWYAQEARCYALVMMLSVLSLIIFDSWLSKESAPVKSDKIMKRLILINTLLLYTHYLTIFIILSQALYVLLFRKDAFKSCFYMLKMTGLFFALWAFAMIRNILTIHRNFWIPPTSSKHVEVLLDRFTPLDYMKWLYLGLIMAGVVYFIFKKDRFIIQMLLMVLVPVVGLLVVSEIIPLFMDRYIIYIFPFFHVLVVYILFTLIRPAVIPVMLGLLLLYPRYGRVNLKQSKGQDIKAAVAKIKKSERERTEPSFYKRSLAMPCLRITMIGISTSKRPIVMKKR